MMPQRTLILVGFGFLAGLLASLSWTHSAAPQAAAQAPAAKAEAARYQITSWAYPGVARQGGGFENPKYGAYIVDTLTGEVWVVREDNAPRSLGKVGKP